jgi:hypothetical protein
MGAEKAENMDQPGALRKRTFEGLAQFLVALWAMLFLSAWSLRYWEGWVFWFEFLRAGSFRKK